MKKQVVIIHGGDTFDTYEEYLKFLKDFEIKSLDYFRNKGSWKNNFQQRLGEDFEFLQPRMPNQMNAKYIEWELWFKKILDLLDKDFVLIGYSLGGIFLIKYLSENIINKKIESLHLVAAPYDGEGTEYSMADFVITNDLKNVEKQSPNIFFYQSKDDTSVPALNVEKYKVLLPKATILIFEDRGHFRQEEFPELVENIKKFS